MACDICGETHRTLVPLLDSYKTETISHICEDCEKIVNKRLAEFKSVTHNILKDWVKRFMNKRRADKARAD